MKRRVGKGKSERRGKASGNGNEEGAEKSIGKRTGKGQGVGEEEIFPVSRRSSDATRESDASGACQVLCCVAGAFAV